MTANQLNWTALGKALRQSADDAHEGDTPSVELAYQFLLDNPECFMPVTLASGHNYDMDWPSDMPQVAPEALVLAYWRRNNAEVIS